MNENQQPSAFRTDVGLVKDRLLQGSGFHENLLEKPELIQQLLEQPSTIVQRGEQRRLVHFILENPNMAGRDQLIDQLKKDVQQDRPSLLLKNVVREARKHPQLLEDIQNTLYEANDGGSTYSLPDKVKKFVEEVMTMGVRKDESYKTINRIKSDRESMALAKAQEATATVLPDFRGMSIEEYRNVLESSLTTSSELERSLRSFAMMVLDLYLQRDYHRGTRIQNLNLDFDKLVMETGSGTFEMKLPEGRSILDLVTRSGDNAPNAQIWGTKIIVGEVEDGNKSVYGGRLNAVIAGQKDDGRWENIGRFENLLVETPDERNLRLIQDEWTQGDIIDDKQRADVAARVILSNLSINYATAHDLNPVVLGALKNLHDVALNQEISQWRNLEGYRALPEFDIAKRILATFIESNPEGVMEGARFLIEHKSAMIMPYELEEDPIAVFKKAEGFKKIISIDVADFDRYVGMAREISLPSGEINPDDIVEQAGPPVTPLLKDEN